MNQNKQFWCWSIIYDALPFRLPHISVSLWQTSSASLISSASRSSSCSQTSSVAGKISEIICKFCLRWMFPCKCLCTLECCVSIWLKFMASLRWPHHVPLSPPTGRSWRCRLSWSGCASLRCTPDTDAASPWTATMFGRRPDCCFPEWTASPVSSGTAVRPRAKGRACAARNIDIKKKTTEIAHKKRSIWDNMVHLW